MHTISNNYIIQCQNLLPKEIMLSNVIRAYTHNKEGVIKYLKQDNKELILCNNIPIGEISRWLDNIHILLYKDYIGGTNE